MTGVITHFIIPAVSSSCRSSIVLKHSFSLNSVSNSKTCIAQYQPPNNEEDDDQQNIPSRRTANYKPNIWNYNHIQLLPSQYADDKYKSQAKKLKQESTCMLKEAKDPLSKLQLIDTISKLGLSHYFQMEIKESLDTILFSSSGNYTKSMDLYFTSLCFRILRLHGFYASQDMFSSFLHSGKFVLPGTETNAEELLELFEASHLATDEENILSEARSLSIHSLKNIAANSSDKNISKRVSQALNLPLHWNVGWYNVKRQIHEHEGEGKILNSNLIELAKVNFNTIQAVQQQDLQHVTRWWVNLGIKKKLTFCRDRMVESFMCAGGVVFEHQHTRLRRWLSKVINLVIVIDDLFDVYGSFEELERFTAAVARWNPEEVKELPECMKIGFWALFNTTNDIALEIQKENHWNNSVLPYLQKAWGEFCKSMLLESKWYNNGYTPSLQEYLNNGLISSSGPLLSLHIIFPIANPRENDILEFLKESEKIIYHASIIIRLCNDLGTSTEELKRGDAPSSILCYMREANVTEEAARDHIKSIIFATWRKLNSYCFSMESSKLSYHKYIINTARMAQFTYQHGDGIGIQQGHTTTEVLSNLIQPFPLSA